MKKILFILVMLMTVTVAYCQSTVTCNTCNGYKVLRCSACNGGGIVYSQVWNPYYGCYQTVQLYCGCCGGRGSVTCNRCNGYGYLVVNNQPSFKGKLKSSCNLSKHKCTGGYDSNSDGWCDVCWKNGYKCHMASHQSR